MQLPVVKSGVHLPLLEFSVLLGLLLRLHSLLTVVCLLLGDLSGLCGHKTLVLEIGRHL
jgi:hypothetical protein